MVYIPRNPTKIAKKKKAKFRNKIVYAQGKKFDSIKERDRWFYLKDCQRVGKIRNLRQQVTFKLDVNGDKVTTYRADFTYQKRWPNNHDAGTTPDGWMKIVEDVKSKPTAALEAFKIKMALMKAVHGIDVRLVYEPTLPI